MFAKWLRIPAVVIRVASTPMDQLAGRILIRELSGIIVFVLASPTLADSSRSLRYSYPDQVNRDSASQLWILVYAIGVG